MKKNAAVEKVGSHYFVTDSNGTDGYGMDVRGIFSKPYDTEAGATRFLAKYKKMTGRA